MNWIMRFVVNLEFQGEILKVYF